MQHGVNISLFSKVVSYANFLQKISVNRCLESVEKEKRESDKNSAFYENCSVESWLVNFGLKEANNKFDYCFPFLNFHPHLNL